MDAIAHQQAKALADTLREAARDLDLVATGHPEVLTGARWRGCLDSGVARLAERITLGQDAGRVRAA